MKDVFSKTEGSCPLVMSIPHLGQAIPDALANRMTPEARKVPDTDWDLDRLYGFAEELGVHIIKAHYSRYVVDLNRPPDDAPLYPGADNTGLVPVSTFASGPIYLPGEQPEADEIAARRTDYWQPYHTALEDLLEAVRTRFRIAILFDCHSIKSVLPRFFDGRLPDINLGTAEGISCAPDLQDVLAEALGRDGSYSLAVNGRFKGGYITRAFGRPDKAVHAYQIEHSTAVYMDEEPWFAYRADLAEAAGPVLRGAMERAIDWAESRAMVTT
jgi:N-formylglutamate deformylase